MENEITASQNAANAAMISAEAAAKAAALVKSTAETTATALNIQYIQRDITDIKQSLKEMTGTFVRSEDFIDYAKKTDDHEVRMRSLETFMNTLIGKMAMMAFGSSIIVSLVFIGINYLLNKG